MAERTYEVSRKIEGTGVDDDLLAPQYQLGVYHVVGLFRAPSAQAAIGVAAEQDFNEEQMTASPVYRAVAASAVTERPVAVDRSVRVRVGRDGNS